MRRLILLPLLLVATSLFAQPVITGISPAEGPTAGGTVVTITGSGFEADAVVSFVDHNAFGQIRLHDAKVLSSTTIVATTPAHPAGAVSMTLFQGRSNTSSKVGFVYVGSDADAVERYLVPILLPPVAGANGSEFRSVLRFWNAGIRDVAIGGLPWSGVFCGLCPDYPYSVIGPGGAFDVSATFRNEWPARWLDVANDDGSLAMNLRVYDTSRSERNFGTEIPIVPQSAFRSRIVLSGIPIDSRYRLRLRVYGDRDGVVGVELGNHTRLVALSSGWPDYRPSYVEVPLSQADQGRATTANLSVVASPGSVEEGALQHIWAFVTITNNETQHITTMTPQPSR